MKRKLRVCVCGNHRWKTVDNGKGIVGCRKCGRTVLTEYGQRLAEERERKLVEEMKNLDQEILVQELSQFRT